LANHSTRQEDEQQLAACRTYNELAAKEPYQRQEDIIHECSRSSLDEEFRFRLEEIRCMMPWTTPRIRMIKTISP